MSATGTVREESQSMEFSVTKSALLDELTTTQGVVERKTTIPILSNLLVEAKGSTLTITATDLELSVRTSCEAKIKKEGAGTIPAKKLLELVHLLPEGEIKFKLLDNHRANRGDTDRVGEVCKSNRQSVGLSSKLCSLHPGPVLATGRTGPRKLRAKVQVGKPLAQPIHPSRGRKPTLTGLGAVMTVSTIIYGPCRSRLRLARFSRQSSKTGYYSRRGTPSPTRRYS